MTYKEIAQKLITNLGGKDNILDYATCMTRFRIKLKDMDKVNHEAITSTEKILGIANDEDQYQIIAEIDSIPLISEEFQKLSGAEVKSMKEIIQEGKEENEKDKEDKSIIDKIKEIF